MLKVGLTGGMGCGKSFVAAELQRLGCHLIEADRLGHAVLAPGGEAYDAVVREFGPHLLQQDGSIDRRELAAEVFDNPERLALLNALVHPPVKAREKALLEALEARDPHAIVIVEAAILVETGSYRNYDRLIVVVCNETTQLERAMARDGATLKDVQARLSRQMPLMEKQKFADYIIDTSGTPDDTLRQTAKVYSALRREAAE
jgi:dephospho-CoA kinase